MKFLLHGIAGLIISFYSGSIIGQVNDSVFICHTFDRKESENSHLRSEDSVFLVHLPKLEVANNCLNKDLPYKIDNSVYPWLRPVFLQDGACCGQAASIGYHFTYEMDRARDLPADQPENQYPTHFAWNFLNVDNGLVGCGVNFFESDEILRMVGSLTVAEYGGMSMIRGDSLRWITGYEKYFSAMHNRIEGVYRIDVGNSEGLLTLKQWLYDHLDGSTTGGTANFYSSIRIYYRFPEGTPEAGKAVMTTWNPAATHAMTIVGYNDSIRWDYNHDGQYTNNLDINDDGVVDMKDREIGGLKFVNSYQENWADSGFCYMMYKTLADAFESGGIWNNSVFVVKVKPDYHPLLTLKITLTHTSRDKIKVTAGISSDTSKIFPDHEMDFPILNYQGGDHYMQGGELEADKTIEIGLDITPLLSYMIPDEPARIFFNVYENDPLNKATGEIIGWSVIDYTHGMQEKVYQTNHIPIIENNVTRLSLMISVNTDKVNIFPDTLAPFVSGELYAHQFNAGGGLPPYSWSLQTDYTCGPVDGSFAMTGDEQLFPSNNTETGMVTKTLDFEFPFYNHLYDSVVLHTGGYLMFDKQTYPLPYPKDMVLQLRSGRSVAPLMTRSLVIIPGNGDGIWYEGDEHQAVFRWQLSDGNHTVNTSFNFAVTLYPDGRITFQYGDMIHDYPVDWAAGISDGDMTDYLVSGSSLNDNVATIQDIGFRIPDVPTGLTLSQDGLLSGILAYPGKIDDIRVMVTDRNNISDSKPFQLSSGLFFDYFILAGDDSIINRNEDVTVGFDISNLTGDTLHQAFLSASVDDPSILLTDSVKSLGTLLPFQTLSLPEGIRFRTGSSMPDGYNIPLDLTFTSEERSWNKSLILVASAPRLAFGGLRVDDAGNGILEGGETADLIIKVDNLGHCPAHGVACRLSCLDPFISMNQSPWLQYGDIPERSCKENEINITVNPNTPEGYFTWIHATICDSEGWHTGDSIYLAIGNVPILIVDLDKNLNSGPVIRQTILENHLGVDYRNFSPWWDLYKYDVVFLCLGIFPNHYKLDSVAASYFVSYLNAGGRLYLEGGATWHNDHPTALQPMFNIEGDYVGYPHPPDTLIGQPSTFTQDISMHYTGEKARIANLYPLGSAFSFFNDLHTGYSYGVAFDTVGYKTIGTSFEFGGLYDSTYPSVKTELMRRYLDFFGITTNALAANFTADTLTLQAGTVIPFHDLSTKDVIAWNWTFNGGTPSSSSEPEPVIRYDSAGIFDVTLTVSNGDHNNTLTKKGYITVFSGHGVEDLNRDMAISIFPNPTEGRFILTVLPAHPRRLSFSIVNNIGQMILKKEPLPLSFAGTVSFDLGNRPSGMYFIIVNDGDRQIVKKVVLMR